MTALAWVLYKSWWCERIEVRNKANTTTTAERVGKKNETEHCKNYDSPISLRDPQASTTQQAAVCPLYKYFVRVANTLLGFKGAKSSRE
jgi:hypothetical protein